VTVKGCPATVNVPVRELPPKLATENATVPFPVPDAPPVTVIQLSFEDAVHPHEAPAVTAIEPVPPTAVKDWHGVDGAAWVTVNVRSAIVSVPVRAAAPEFTPTVNVTLPLPVPDAVRPSVIQESFDTAVQAHAGPVVTDTVPLPPADVKSWFVGARV
jgi:hypothetical protein